MNIFFLGFLVGGGLAVVTTATFIVEFPVESPILLIAMLDFIFQVAESEMVLTLPSLRLVELFVEEFELELALVVLD